MKQIITLLTIALVGLSAWSQGVYEKKVYAVGTDTLRYRELVPEKVSMGKQYPLVIFMHGAGERGIDNEKQLAHGSQMFLNPVNRKKYPAYVVFPQCPPNGYWAYGERPESFQPDSMPVVEDATVYIKLIRGLVNEYLKDSSVDPNRVYVIGLSMGGMATYDLAVRYPNLFAAVVPICGTVNPKRLDAAKGVRFRIFHGDADNIVPVEASREAYLKLKQIGADVEYMEFAGCNHGSWNPAFNQPDFMSWLFKSVRKAG